MKAEKQLRPRKRPVQSRAKDTVETILETAAQVLSERGYAEATTNRIASRAGVSIGSLYQYFPNKDTIFVSLMERHIEDMEAFVNNMLSKAQNGALPLDQMLRDFLEAIVAFHMKDPRLHKVLFEEVPHPPSIVKPVRRILEEASEGVETILTKAPNIRTKNPSLAARLIVQTIEALTHWYVLYAHDDIDSGEFIDETFKILWGYLSSNDQNESPHR